jgi:hypothetical protein
MTTPRLTPWQTLTLTDGERDIPAMSSEGLTALEEYRRASSIKGYWPCTTRELRALSDVEAADAGLPVEAIDWTGLPTSDEVRRIVRNVGRTRAPMTAEDIADAVAD